MKKIAIIENSEGLGNYFTKFLEMDEYRIFPVWKSGQLPDDDFNAYIFTGDYNNISDGLLPIHEKEIEFVKSMKNRKIFASCFFHQLIGVIFGGKIGRREKRFFGWYEMVIKKAHPILHGLNDPYFLNLNIDEIKIVPEKAELLATNQVCKYQVLLYGDNIFTCQSHPEIYKQEALESIAKTREGLLDGCPDLDIMLQKTERYADDENNKIFMENMTEWLRS